MYGLSDRTKKNGRCGGVVVSGEINERNGTRLRRTVSNYKQRTWRMRLSVIRQNRQNAVISGFETRRLNEL